MIPKTDQHGHHEETLLVKAMKSLWYTVVLWLLIFCSSVIFMGIEGNYKQLVGWRNMEELEQFNKSLYKWITKNKSVTATSLRAEIGLTDHLEERDYVRIAQKQMNKNFTKLSKRFKTRCDLANHDLKSWHNMTHSMGDSFMYAVSILSTVGWGVHAPPSMDLRAVAIVYAIIGIPLFTAFIGFQMSFVEYVENRMKRHKFVQRYMGGGTTINAAMGVVMLTVALLYSKFSLYMVNEEKNNPSIREDLKVIGDLDHWSYFTTIYFTFQTVSTIGFGDEYIYSPERGGAMLYIKPIFLIIFTAFLIALFTHVFGKIQARMDKKASKRSRQSSIALQSMKMGVRKASKAVTHKGIFGTNNSSEIQKRLEAIRNENFEHGGFDAMHLRPSSHLSNNQPVKQTDTSLGSQPSSSTTISIMSQSDKTSK